MWPRTGLGFLVVCGCYAPRAPAGVPCDPQAARCPTGQTCASEGGEYVCTTPGGVDTTSDAATPGDGPGDISTDAPGSTRLTYVATIAACLDPTAPDPDFCTTTNGAQQLVIDARDSTTDKPWEGFVRFDVDDAIAGRTVVAVAVRMTATADDKAEGETSGELWAVQPFTSASLTMTTPAKVGSVLAPSHGPVAKLQVIEWSLPVQTVAAGSATFLGLYATDTDGVNYWNLAGPDPPRLIVDLE